MPHTIGEVSSLKEKLTHFFSSRTGIILTGCFIGVFAALLSVWGNPANMGICVACFERDIAGALGLHRADVVQYLRPEIPGFVLGSMIAAYIFGEFKARSGSAPAVRFVLGFFAMIGALAFLGCPWRALLRLAGGDLNAVVGIAGLTAGIAVGVAFLRSGYTLGRSRPDNQAAGLVMPAVMVLFLVLLVADFPALFRSSAGPGSMSAPLVISLTVSLGVGFLAQRTRFCTMGSVRDVLLMRDTHLLSGIVALLLSAAAVNLVFGRIDFGFALQPVAHSNHLWNFLGMFLAGLAFCLAGGCPGRQLILSGEGDGDSTVFVLGMIAGAAISHNFSFAGKPDSLAGGSLKVGGVSPYGMAAVLMGIAVCMFIGFAMKERKI
ncbi:YedE family putative selenium transporter [Marispirochaeta aestuarii]|uniref:YedE family putative selenium transporter n=1 Tax=Marispirochaeta aestuarii TaxID=1963862 RepID=UPI002ABE11B0|nr:YedE family putative selenium transporter [Marispirochaeta aestuarii]